MSQQDQEEAGLSQVLIVIGFILVIASSMVTIVNKFDIQTPFSQAITEQRFLEIAKESGVNARQSTLRKMYRDLESDDDDTLQSERAVMQLFFDLREKTLVYRGNKFHRLEPAMPQPSMDVDQEEGLVANGDRVPLKFFLDHYPYYSRRIFTALTDQNRVDFAFDIDNRGRYGFRVVERLRQRELFPLISRRGPDAPEQMELSGTRWWVPAEDLPEIPRAFAIEQTFVDHRHTARHVSATIDLAHTFVHDGKAILLDRRTATSDFADFVIIDDAIRGLARDITAPYSSPDDQAEALLKFVQSFRYQKDRRNEIKTPQAFLVAREGDCEDASILTVALWEAAGFDAAFLDLSNKVRNRAGHVMPLIASDSCCSGAGVKVDEKLWLFGEATDDGWEIGEDALANMKDMEIAVVRPYKGTPILNSARSRP